MYEVLTEFCPSKSPRASLWDELMTFIEPGVLEITVIVRSEAYSWEGMELSESVEG